MIQLIFEEIIGWDNNLLANEFPRFFLNPTQKKENVLNMVEWKECGGGISIFIKSGFYGRRRFMIGFVWC